MMFWVEFTSIVLIEMIFYSEVVISCTEDVFERELPSVELLQSQAAGHRLEKKPFDGGNG